MTVEWNSADIIARARAGAAKGVVAGTELVRGEAISLILDTPKTGRIYRRRGVEHRASAPGEPPASDTGRLVNSIKSDFGKLESQLTGTVVAGTSYAAYLEFGTSRMEPRPFMRPALANKKSEVEGVITAAVREALEL